MDRNALRGLEDLVNRVRDQIANLERQIDDIKNGLGPGATVIPPSLQDKVDKLKQDIRDLIPELQAIADKAGESGTAIPIDKLKDDISKLEDLVGLPGLSPPGTSPVPASSLSATSPRATETGSQPPGTSETGSGSSESSGDESGSSGGGSGSGSKTPGSETPGGGSGSGSGTSGNDSGNGSGNENAPSTSGFDLSVLDALNHILDDLLRDLDMLIDNGFRGIDGLVKEVKDQISIRLRTSRRDWSLEALTSQA